MKKTKEIKWEFPIPRTHCGIVMGNGNFGALIWGKENLNVTVNRSDFWDHRGGELLIKGSTYEKLKSAFDPEDPLKLARVFIRKEQPKDVFRSTRLPLGRFEFQLYTGYTLQKVVLEPDKGIVTVYAKNKKTGKLNKITLVLSPKKNVLLIIDKKHVIKNVQTQPSWNFVGEELSRYKFDSPIDVRRKKLSGWIQMCPEDPAVAALCRQTADGFLVCLSRGTTPEKTLEAGLIEINTCQKQGQSRFIKTNRTWWHSYWEQIPSVSLPSKFYGQFLNYALYKFACATNPNSPIPAGLQGPWVEEHCLPPWSADYHFNVNIQQIYTLAFPSNNLDHLLPLFDMLDSFREVMRQNAKILVGIEDGLALAHAVDDRGYACGGISAGSSIDHAVSGWTAQLYWLYYEYTSDEKFLRERAFPFMKGVMRVYEEMLETKGEKFSLPIGISAEYAVIKKNIKQRVGRNPSYQLACIHMIVDALLKASEILNKPPRKIWKQISKNLPAYTLVGETGKERIAIWEGQDIEESHRHHAHLACIYPFDTLGKETPEKRRIIANSIDRWLTVGMSDWSEWCIPWAVIIQARIGFTEGALMLMDIWKKLFVNEGLATVYVPKFPGISMHRISNLNKPANPWNNNDSGKNISISDEDTEIMQLDGTMAAATAIYEMLVHNRNGMTYVFPAVPEEWKNVSFSNIRVPGPFSVSAVKKSGIIREVAVKSLGGKTLRLNVCGLTAMRIPGKLKKTRLPCTLNLSKGETIRLVAESNT